MCERMPAHEAHHHFSTALLHAIEIIRCENDDNDELPLSFFQLKMWKHHLLLGNLNITNWLFIRFVGQRKKSSSNWMIRNEMTSKLVHLKICPQIANFDTPMVFAHFPYSGPF